MYRSQVLVLIASALFSSEALSAKTPSFIHPCNEASDDCITQAVRDALPGFSTGVAELGVFPLDPFQVNEIDLVLPGGLKIALNNATFVGMRRCVIEKASLVKTTFDLRTRCNITVKGKYRANGRILLFPINGHGDAKIKVSNIRLHVQVYTKNEIASDGQYHVVIKSIKKSYEWGEKVSFQLANLFDGNPEISNTVLTFLNENWRVVAEEFGEPLVDVVVKRVLNNIKNFFAALPYKDLINTPITLD